jgi:parallel beta-helix repeat protein
MSARRYMISKLVALVLLAASGTVLRASLGNAATLYVDKANSSCTDSGTGTQPQPFCTIGAANSKAVAGDTVVVKPGIYAEKVTVAKSGTSSAPIAFTADGSVTLSGNYYGFEISGKNWITIQGFKISDVSYHGLKIVSASNISITNVHITDAAGRGAYITNSSQLTLSNSTIENSNDYGIYAASSSGLTFANNTVARSGHPQSGSTRKGMYINGVADSTISNNLVDSNSDSGIYLVNGSMGITIKNNTAKNNASVYVRQAPGIDIRSSNNIVQANISFENEDSGIQFYGGASSNLAVNNVCFRNGDHGIDTLNSAGNRYISNSIYDNVTAGINVEGTSTGALIADNISVDNGINSPRTQGNIRVDSVSVSGAVIDYNLVYLTQPGTMYTWGKTFYASLDALHAAQPNVDVHAIEADPLWPDAAAGYFQLGAGSPAIDSANSGASGESAIDAEGNARIDDPGVPNTGTGQRDYDDRGAYEFQGQTAPPPNGAPEIVAGPAATPNPVLSLGTADLTVEATDPDGDQLNYTWTVPAFSGSITGSGPAVTYTAPAVGTSETYTVTVQISDGFGALTEGHVDVQVVPPPGQQMVAVRSVADAYVSQQYPDQNHCCSSTLYVDSGPDNITYLRFDVSGVTGSISLARIRMEVVNPSNTGGSIYAVQDNTWQENTLTYNNRPPIDDAAVDTLGAVDLGETVAFDVTSAITGDGTYSFAVLPDSGDGVDYASRENSSVTPVLEILFTQ